MTELFGISLTVLRRRHTLETVKLLIIVIEFLTVTSFLAVRMLSAAPRLTATMIMMILLYLPGLPGLPCQEIDCDQKHQAGNQKYHIFHLGTFFACEDRE